MNIPIFDLGAHSLNLSSSSAAVEMLGNGNSSILLLTFTVEVDSSLPNNLVIEVILHDVVGYLSSDSQSIEIKANDEVWTACKAEIKIENNKKLIFVKSSDLAWSELDAGKLVLRLRIGADNMVLPSYIVSDLTIKNDANRTLFQTSNLSLNTGCDVGCTICFFDNKSSCVRCSEGFELLSNRCLIIVPKATLAELLGTNFLINRNTVSAICALGLFAVIFIRFFVSRLYWNIISTEIITKIVITNICNLAILARAISNTDEGKLTYMLWITFMNTNFIINLLMTCIFWMLAKPYPILRLDKKSSAALYLMYIMSCLSSAANLLWLVSDRNVLDRLIKDKKTAEIKPTDVNAIVNDKNKRRSSKQKALDDKIVVNTSNTRVKRKSKSLNDMQLDVIEPKASLKDNQTDDLSTTATKGQEPHNLNNSNAIPVNDSTSNNELPALFDFLNMLRWLNFSLKATLLVAIVALSVFSEYRPWTKSPFDICIVISIELVFYGMCTVDKPESTEWRNKFELRARKIMLDDRKKTKGLKLNRSSPEEDQSHAIINLERNSMLETNNIPNLQLPLGINQQSISPEDMPGHSKGLMDIKDSGISWHNMVNAIIDKGKSDDLDDFQDYDVDSMIHETDKDFKQFARENGFIFKKGFPVKLTRSTSLEKSSETTSPKECIYVKYFVHRVEKRQEEIFLSSSESEECEDIGEAGQDKPHVEMISNYPEVRIQVDDESREVEKIGDSEYGKY